MSQKSIHITYLLPCLLLWAPATHAQAFKKPPYCKQLEIQAANLKKELSFSNASRLATQRGLSFFYKRIRVKELALQQQATKLTASLEKNGEKFAESLESVWDGSFRENAIGLNYPLPPLPDGINQLHDTVNGNYLGVSFNFDILNTNSSDRIFESYLKTYFQVRYNHSELTASAQQRNEIIRNQLIEKTRATISNMRNELKKIIAVRLSSSLCRPLEEGGNDCGMGTLGKVRKARTKLSITIKKIARIQDSYDRITKTFSFRACSDPSFRFKRVNCRALTVNVVGTLATISVIPEQLYVLSASGTYSCMKGSFISDAKYTSSYGGPFLDAPVSFNPEFCDLGIIGEPTPDWGAYNESHEYETLYRPKKNKLTFWLHRANAEGGLQMQVCEAVPINE